MDDNRKNLIFSMYQVLPDDQSHEQLEEYHDRLLQNKIDYASKIGAEFKMHTPFDMSYVELQHYKFELLDKYARQYNKVMYVDMDVHFNTDENVFDHHEGLCLYAKDYSEDLGGKLDTDMNTRSWYYKHFLADALCMYGLTTYDGMIPNTGLMIVDEPTGFTEALPEIKALVDEVNAEDMWPLKFDYNNEALFAYYCQANGIKWNQMDDEWNHIHRKKQPFHPDRKIYHFISKEFEHAYQPTTTNR